MLATSYHNNNRVTFYRVFYTATKQGRFMCNEAAGFKTYLNIKVTT